jgi:hypothetical protein
MILENLESDSSLNGYQSLYLNCRAGLIIMAKRPHSITIISWIFIVFGGIAILIGLLPLFDSAAAGRIMARPSEFWPIQIIRIHAVVCGAFMLYGFNWARWLLVICIGCHGVLSLLLSPFELFVHGLLLPSFYIFSFAQRWEGIFEAREPSRRRFQRRMSPCDLTRIINCETRPAE